MAIRETGETLDLTQCDMLDLRGWDTSNGHETEPGKEPTAVLRVNREMGTMSLDVPKTDREFVPLIVEDSGSSQGDA